MLGKLQKEKLRRLRLEFRLPKARPKKGLKGLNLAAADLTPEFLLSVEPKQTLEEYINPPTLQLLTERGYLPQIPAACLTSEVVFARVYLPFNDLDAQCDRPSYKINFLLFCAKFGFYNLLPAKYQTREAILHHPDDQITTPLHAAANCGHLDKMPVQLLQPGDLYIFNPLRDKAGLRFDDILVDAVGHKQVEYISRLVDAKLISSAAIGACFYSDYFPQIIMDNLTADTLLEGAPDAWYALRTAASYGKLDKVDPALFVNHFKLLQESQPMEAGEITRRLGSVNLPSLEEVKKKTEEWLLQVAHLRLKAKGKELRNQPENKPS